MQLSYALYIFFLKLFPFEVYFYPHEFILMFLAFASVTKVFSQNSKFRQAFLNFGGGLLAWGRAFILGVFRGAKLVEVTRHSTKGAWACLRAVCQDASRELGTAQTLGHA